MLSAPDHLLTLAEWDLLPEDRFRRAELAKGVLQVNPRPGGKHQILLTRLLLQMAGAAQVSGLFPVPDLDVLIDSRFPPTVRQPDLSVVARATADAGPQRLLAAEVLLAVEIVSPGSTRRDRVTKRAEYAAAGIRNYWIFDLAGAAITMDAFELDGSDYRLLRHGNGGHLTFEEPFPVTLDLDALRTW